MNSFTYTLTQHQEWMVPLFSKSQVHATKVIPFISVAQKSQVFCFNYILFIDCEGSSGARDYITILKWIYSKGWNLGVLQKLLHPRKFRIICCHAVQQI